jgi:hypothetical protein
MSKGVFISYASVDVRQVQIVCDDLRGDGISCWMAPDDVPPGADFAEVIPKAISTSGLVLLFLSAGANASDNVRREAHLAVLHKIPILPVRLEPVQPERALQFLLADAQWIDAFPRVAPRLGSIREEVRRRLPVPDPGSDVDDVRANRRPFERALASVAAWVTVFGLTLLLLTLMQRTWFNLVPVLQVPALALRNPLVVVGAVAPILLALLAQFGSHRNASRVLSLDALFGTLSAGARLRTALAGGLAGVFAAGVWFTPPAVSIRLEEAPVDRYNTGLVRAYLQVGKNYLRQCNSHFVIATRVSGLNPPGVYTIQVHVRPFATEDGIEFGQIWIDTALGITQVSPVADDPRRSASVTTHVPLDAIAGDRLLKVAATHYRDAVPSGAYISASIGLDDGRRIEATPRMVPASLFCAG